MKKIIYLPFLFLLSLFVISCSGDDPILDPIDPELPKVAIENLLNETTVAQEDTLLFKAVIISDTESQFSWLINGNPTGETDSVFQFIPTETGTYTLTLSCVNERGEAKINIAIEVYGKYRHGTWILNEGNMTTENGSLIFISPKGVVTDSAYFRVNGTDLGNVTQDLFIKNGKMYIISQNGNKNAVGTEFENDGMLVVANSGTLKREAAYNDELSELSWPTHIAVLDDDNIFIRDNGGIHRFSSITGELSYIDGTRGANKNQMVVTGNKLFVIAGRNLLVLQPNNPGVTQTIDMGASISGIVKSRDGNLFVSTTGNPGKITKIDSGIGGVIKANEITQGALGARIGGYSGYYGQGRHYLLQ